jgi:hypothetical protein
MEDDEKEQIKKLLKSIVLQDWPIKPHDPPLHLQYIIDENGNFRSPFSPKPHSLEDRD